VFATTRPRSGGRRGLVTVAAIALTASLMSMAGASTGPTAVPLRSQYETASRVVSRDVGISVMLPDGHDLWLFGDTLTYQRVDNRWAPEQFITGNSALEATPTRGHVPRGREYPQATPSRLLPVPADVYLPDGSGTRCTTRTAAYPARWITGAAVRANDHSQLLITYADVCVQHGPTITTEGWGFVLYDWRARRILYGPDDVFAPNSNGSALSGAQVFVTPVFDGNRLILFSSECVAPSASCQVGPVWFASMPATIAAMRSSGSYQPQLLPLGLPSTWSAMTVSVGRYPAGWRLLETTSIWGTYKVFSSSSPTGTWQLEQSATLPGCPTKTGTCWAVQGHPELSSATRLLISYYKPDAGPGGHIVVSAVPT
jgi:hypothetical protein